MEICFIYYIKIMLRGANSYEIPCKKDNSDYTPFSWELVKWFQYFQKIVLAVTNPYIVVTSLAK